MKSIYFSLSHIQLTFLILIVIFSSAISAENIVKQEKLSFEKCLQVIETSKTKLSIIPKIIEKSRQMRQAIFALPDGTLTIICDGKNELVIVSTKTN